MNCDEANGYDWELNLLCRLHNRASAGLNQLRSTARKQVQQLKMRVFEFKRKVDKEKFYPKSRGIAC
ncbi:MAG: hypothetical protein ACJAR3_000862 [Roseivirga sp.]|jgi:hypothetical protein